MSRNLRSASRSKKEIATGSNRVSVDLMMRQKQRRDERPIMLRPKEHLRALIVIANPSNLHERYRLALLDVPTEYAQENDVPLEMPPFEWVLCGHNESSCFYFSPTLADQLSLCNTARSNGISTEIEKYSLKIFCYLLSNNLAFFSACLLYKSVEVNYNISMR